MLPLSPISFNLSTVDFESDYFTIKIQTDELFMLPLSPISFNLSTVDFESDYFSYAASLHNLPDLPIWIKITYNAVLKMAFLYGTPPSNLETEIELDLVASNLINFETPIRELTLEVVQKQDPARRQIQMKIHNLNVDDLMDDRKLSKLLDIFRNELWHESSEDIHLIKLHSALLVGGRHPVRLEDGEGVILTLGSRSEFSEALRDLEREVSPLWSHRSCPRNFKKTSVERNFRSKGFIIDWCSFQLTPQNTSLIMSSSTTAATGVESKTERAILKSHLTPSEEIGLWRAPTKSEVPRRSYAEDGIIAIFVPVMLLLVLVGLLTAILGIHPEGEVTEEGLLYEGVFEELPFLNSKPKKVSSAGNEELISSPLNKNHIRARNSESPSIPSAKRNIHLFDSMAESATRDSSPFLMSSISASATPASTLSRSAFPTPRSTLAPSERASTLGRPEPPPYYVPK
nr:EOG090X04W0 [Polyphemus pediculus]